jgi:hypothetical protein
MHALTVRVVAWGRPAPAHAFSPNAPRWCGRSSSPSAPSWSAPCRPTRSRAAATAASGSSSLQTPKPAPTRLVVWGAAYVWTAAVPRPAHAAF